MKPSRYPRSFVIAVSLGLFAYLPMADAQAPQPAVSGSGFIQYFHKVPNELLSKDTPEPVRDEVTTACPKVDAPPTIDGKLDDAVWKKVPWNTHFSNWYGLAMAQPNTEFAVCHDDQAMYLAVRCAEPDTAGIVAKATAHDGEVYYDDSLEIFLDPGRSNLNFYQLSVNTKGVQADQFNITPGWNEPWESKVVVEPGKGWTVECKFPCSSFKGSKPEGEWGFNLVRNRPRRDDDSNMVWRCAFGTAKPPATYGRLRFTGPAIALDHGVVTNCGAAEQTVTLKARLTPRGAGRVAPVAEVAREVQVKLSAGQSAPPPEITALFQTGTTEHDVYRNLIVDAVVGGQTVASESWRWTMPQITGQIVWPKLDETMPRVEVRVWLYAQGEKQPVRISYIPVGADGKPAIGDLVPATTIETPGPGEYEFNFTRPPAGKYVLTLSAAGGKYEIPFEVVAGKILR